MIESMFFEAVKKSSSSSSSTSSSRSMYQQDERKRQRARNIGTMLVSTLLCVVLKLQVKTEVLVVDAFISGSTSSTSSFMTKKHPATATIVTSSSRNTKNLFMAKGKGGKKKRTSKGFGSTPPPPSSEQFEATASTTTTTTTTTVVPSSSDNDNSSSSSSSTTPKVTTPMNAGQKALEKLRQERQSKKDDELRQLINLKEQDEVVRSNPDAAVIPERVAQKMTQRMIPFVALPIVGSLSSFVVFWYLATYKNYEFQPAVVAITTIGFLALGLFGITYSMMSTPWDDSTEAEGSLLGIDEFQTNISNLKEGLSRSRDNLKLREQMKGLPESEIQAAIRDLERRERKASNKGKTFEDKLKDEGL